MNSKNIIFIIVFIAAISCAREKNKKVILDRKTFVSLLIQMHITDAKISFTQSIDQQQLEKSYEQYDSLFKSFGTDSLIVSGTFDHYENRQDELKLIYQEVTDSLVLRARKSVKK